MEVNYKDPADRTVDTQYQDLLRDVYENGEDIMPIHGEIARMKLGAQLRYDMSNGFPLITERDISGLYGGAISEHVAFLNGARTQKELEEYGCKWWARWLTEEQCSRFGLETGDLGDGSYGAAWTNFPTSEGEPFDQIEHFVKQIKEMPFLRTHVITPWIPQYTLQHEGLTRKVVVAPCHGYIHATANPEKKELSIHHFQRSGDLPVGVPFNMIQYGVFGIMLARIMDYTFKEMVFSFSDAHIYESQFPFVEELISREPRKLGTLTLKKEVDTTNIKDFRAKDFELSDYDAHDAMRIPTPT